MLELIIGIEYITSIRIYAVLLRLLGNVNTISSMLC